ncbi:SseB family protein [Dokdonella soli]|uniref:SseB protein N-terminal domain-containing protein n=1 Tax=Dokdonella soli TaxID=529810 RepID=A0ABN1IGZ1_9GAMM
MTTTEELDALLRRAARDGRADAAFLRAMLSATMYTLAPLSDDHPRLRLFMYQRSDGIFFVPLFTDEAKAVASAQGQLRVLSSTGQQLLEISLGAVVIVNPNDEHCTLYPEEIETLLATGRVADIDTEAATAGGHVVVRESAAPPAWLVKRLQTLYAGLSYVEAARLLYIARQEEPEKGVLTVVIVTTSALAERAVRATITAIQEDCRRANLPLDVTFAASDKPGPSLAGHGQLIYARKE